MQLVGYEVDIFLGQPRYALAEIVHESLYLLFAYCRVYRIVGLELPEQ